MKAPSVNLPVCPPVFSATTDSLIGAIPAAANPTVRNWYCAHAVALTVHGQEIGIKNSGWRANPYRSGGAPDRKSGRHRAAPAERGLLCLLLRTAKRSAPGGGADLRHDGTGFPRAGLRAGRNGAGRTSQRCGFCRRGTAGRARASGASRHGSVRPSGGVCGTGRLSDFKGSHSGNPAVRHCRSTHPCSHRRAPARHLRNPPAVGG